MLPQNYQSTSMYLIMLQDTKLIHRNLLHFYTLIMKDQNGKLKKPSHLPSHQKEYLGLYLGINLHKKTKDLFSKKCKTLMKQIKDDTNRQRDIPYSWIKRINIVKNDYTTQGNLQIQYNPYQITSGIFHRIRTKYLKSCKQTKKDHEQPKQS